MAYVVPSEPLVFPPPANIRLMFRYQQGVPIWRTPVNDPIQFGSGFLIIANQPGLQITRLKYVPTILDWLTASGGRLLTFDHPVPFP